MSLIIVGIDPGSRATGFGAVHAERASGRISHIEHAAFVAPSSWDFASRLAYMHEKLLEALARIRPNAAAVEKIFLGRSADSAFKLGHARGVCMLAARQSGAEVHEYAARSVKKGITGSGAAEKSQVQLILFATLGIRDVAKLDASDALALAFYHARCLEVADTMRRAESRGRELR